MPARIGVQIANNMSRLKTVRAEDLLYVMFRSAEPAFDFENTYGEWYSFLNIERGIRTSKNSDHRWLRLRGVKIENEKGIDFDSEVEPIFLRSTREGEPPEAVEHQAHPHSNPSGCILNLRAFVWTRVNKSHEPGIRDYVRSKELDRLKYFCVEQDRNFLTRFFYYLSEAGFRFDISEAEV
jgi:hypothetical protein